MTTMVREWLFGVICASMIAALCEYLAPDGSVKRICRFAGGAVLILAVIGPVLRLEEHDMEQLTKDYQNQAQEYSAELEAQNEILLESIIAEETAAYILDKAEALGISCRAAVTVAWDADEIPCPQSVKITGTWTQEQRSELSRLIREDLGIPEELQYFEEVLP